MRARAFAPAGYLLVALALFGGVLPVMGHSWIGLDADAKAVVSFLDLVAQALRHGNDPLLTNVIQAPGGVNLMWNPSLILPGILLTPLTLTAGPYAAYDVLVIAAPVLSAWAAFAALRRLVTSPAAAWVGGLVYGFSPAVLAESLGHLQTAMAWYPPVVLLLLHEALIRRAWPLRRVGALWGLATTAALLTSEEMVLGTALVTAFGLAFLALQHRDRARAGASRLAFALAVAAGIAAVLAAVPLAVQLFGPNRPAGRLFSGDVVVADAGGLLVPASRQLLSVPGMLADPWSLVTEDAGAYIGLPVLLLLLIAWNRLRRTSVAVRWSVPVVALTTVLALGPHLHIGGNTTAFPLPWIIFDKLPLFEDLAPARLMVVAWLAIAVVVAVAVERALEHRVRQRWVPCALIAAALVTLLPAPVPITAVSVPAYFSSADAAAIPTGDTVLITPLAGGAELTVLIWQVEAGVRWRMVDGEAWGQNQPTFFPRSLLTNALAAMESGIPADPGGSGLTQMQGDLRRLGVGTVIVSAGAHQQDQLRLMRRVLGPEMYAGGGAHVWHDVGALLSRLSPIGGGAPAFRPRPAS